MSRLKIKVPVLITAPIENPVRTYDAMKRAVLQRIEDYNNMPLESKAVVLYRKKLKSKTIKFIENTQLDIQNRVPVLLLRIEEFKTGHEDVYLHTNIVEEEAINSTDQLGSKKNFVLLYPLLEFMDEGTVQNKWCAFVYSDPSKDDSDIKNTAKTVLTRILNYKVKTVLATSARERITQAEAVKQIKVSYVTVDNEDNAHYNLQQYEVKFKHQDSKEIVYEGVPADEAIECITDRNLEGFQKKVVNVKVSDSLSYKYVYEENEFAESMLSAIEENNCYEIDVDDSEIARLHEPNMVLRNLLGVVTQFISNE